MGQHGKHRTLVSLAVAAALWPGQATAQCRLALVLALDVSASVDASEYVLQRDGLAAALQSPDVRDAILHGDGTVAVTIFEWSGRHMEAEISPWMTLASAADIDLLIARIRTSTRSQTEFPTAMGYALGHAATLLAKGPACLRKVIDLSGDGVTNEGFGPVEAYRHFPFDEVVVNGLAVLGSDATVLEYFLETVRHGPGAFVETAPGYEGYRSAMTRKLLRELNDMVIGDAR